MADALHVYVCAWTLCCFCSLTRTQTFRRALTASVDSCAEIKSAPSVAYITNCGRVWRKVPESDARSVRVLLLSFNVAPDRSATVGCLRLRCGYRTEVPSSVVVVVWGVGWGVEVGRMGIAPNGVRTRNLWLPIPSP